MLQCFSKFSVAKPTRCFRSSRRRFSAKISRDIKKKDVRPASEIPITYKPEPTEDQWYNWWETRGFFQPQSNSNEKVFSMVLPPPNVTGELHLGHALTVTIQDVLARWYRMRGYSVLWLPGMDHAGIATQAVVEKYLLKEFNLKRNDLKRGKFIEEVWKWKEIKGSKIMDQLRKLGVSLDWSKFVFTMDNSQSKAVSEAFIQLYDAGLIYRQKALVNWSCALNSAISDIEVDKLKISGPTLLSVPGYDKPVEFGVMTDVAYKLCDDDGDIVVSTTRPETILADVAIAVNPNDSRYTHLKDKYAWHPFQKRKLPIIFDEFVDPEFGTGAVKITPAHDHNDFKIGVKHNLPFIDAIDEHGTIVGDVKFHGLKRFHARKIILDSLNELGLFKGVKDHPMTLPICSRSKDIVELIIKPQWFVDCKPMADRAVQAVKCGELQILPKNYENVWYNWLENTRDWNISRQLWWGHQIPVYECKLKNKEATWVAAESENAARKKLGVSEDEILSVRRDHDVLDTWFSAALFPFSTLGWPLETSSFKQFYPLTLMETGHDILFFWVARMVMFGQQLTGKLPFNKVLLHGIICDCHGKKMSKSLGNVVNPLDIIHGATLEELHGQIDEAYKNGVLTSDEVEKGKLGQKKMFPNGITECGADALRFTLCSHNVQNSFINFDIASCVNNSHFCNKIWQAVKYMRLNLDTLKEIDVNIEKENLNLFDEWILSRLSVMIETMNSALERKEFHVATQAFREFFYGELCDVYLETTKPILKSDAMKVKQNTLSVLFNCIHSSLLVLSPFMPFLSEELYQRLPAVNNFVHLDSVHLAKYPTAEDWNHWKNTSAENSVDSIMKVVCAVRSLRSLYDISKSKTNVHFQPTDEFTNIAVLNKHFISQLAGIQNFSITKKLDLGTTCNVSSVLSIGTVQLLFQISEKEFMRKCENIIKREEKIEKNCSKLLERMSTEDYKRKTRDDNKQMDVERLKSMETELTKIRELKKMSRGLKK